MKGFVTAVSLVFVISAAPSFAQTPAAPAGRGAQTPATPPAGRGGAPATTPAPAAPAPTPPAPPAPFPAGGKIAFVNLQQIAQATVDGKAAAAKVQKLAQDKSTEADNKAKALQADQTRLQTQGNVMSEAARGDLEKKIAQEQRDNDRFQQDAQAEINELQQQLQNDFQKKLFPIIEEIRKDMSLWMVLSIADAGVIVWEPGVDLTTEAIKRMDAKK
jgi:Skp family chaperone for outer membrane proteins